MTDDPSEASDLTAGDSPPESTGPGASDATSSPPAPEPASRPESDVVGPDGRPAVVDGEHSTATSEHADRGSAEPAPAHGLQVPTASSEQSAAAEGSGDTPANPSPGSGDAPGSVSEGAPTPPSTTDGPAVASRPGTVGRSAVTRRGGRTLLAVGVLAAVAAATFAWPAPALPSGSRPGVTFVSLTRRTLVCPDVPAGGHIILTALPASGPLSASIVLDGHALPTVPLTSGVTQVITAPRSGPALISVAGRRAADVVAAQTSRSQTSPPVGYLDAACSAPATDSFFAGAGTVPGEDAKVLLTNPSASPATAIVTVFGGAVVNQTPGGGITVAPHSQVAVPLLPFEAGARSLGVHVHVTGGQLAAALLDVTGPPLSPGGEFLPTISPAAVGVIPAVIAGPGTKSVLVANPGSQTATVTIHVVRTEGTFTPLATTSLAVPGEQALTVDLTALLGKAPAALEFTATRPVLAAAVVRGPTATTKNRAGFTVAVVGDTAVAGTVPARAGTWSVPFVATIAGDTGQLLFVTAPGTSPASVVVQPVSTSGVASAAGIVHALLLPGRLGVVDLAGALATGPIRISSTGASIYLAEERTGPIAYGTGFSVLATAVAGGPLAVPGTAPNPMVAVAPPGAPDPG